MPLLFLLHLIPALFFAVHAVRTGQPFYWLLILLMFPGFGSLVYFFAVYLPQLRNSRAVAAAGDSLARIVDPDKTYRDALARHEDAPTVDNKRRLARELVARGRGREAIPLYLEALDGMYAQDPDLLADLAEAHFALGEPGAALDVLDRLQTHNPTYRSAGAHLLYARCLEDVGRAEEAVREYAAVATYFPGFEPRARHALLLQRLGRVDEARELFQRIVSDASRGPGHVRTAQKDWIRVAESNLA